MRTIGSMFTNLWKTLALLLLCQCPAPVAEKWCFASGPQEILWAATRLLVSKTIIGHDCKFLLMFFFFQHKKMVKNKVRRFLQKASGSCIPLKFLLLSCTLLKWSQVLEHQMYVAGRWKKKSSSWIQPSETMAQMTLELYRGMIIYDETCAQISSGWTEALVGSFCSSNLTFLEWACRI